MPRQYHPEKIPQVYNIDDMPATEIRDGVSQKVFRGLDSLIGITTLEPGLETAPHSHPWEQVAYIMEGSCEFYVGDRSVHVAEGDMFVIPPGVDHYADPTEESVVNLDVWPLREDYLPRSKYQKEFVTYDHE